MSRRHYVNNASVVTLVGSVTSGALTGTVTDASTFPGTTPWSAVIDGGLPTAECVLVTGQAGSVLTWTRGYDNTAAQAHAAGATFAHVATQADYDEANSHIAATANVHGVSGFLVGTTASQSLTNKTLVAPVVTSGATVSGTLAAANAATVGGTLTVTGTVTASGAAHVTGAATAGSLSVTGATTLTGDLVVDGSTTVANLDVGGGAAVAAGITVGGNVTVSGNTAGTGTGSFSSVNGLKAVASGQVTVTPDTANVTKSATVTLPGGRFSAPPQVLLTPLTGFPESVKVSVDSGSPPSTSQFVVNLNRASTTATVIYWVAVATA